MYFIRIFISFLQEIWCNILQVQFINKEILKLIQKTIHKNTKQKLALDTIMKIFFP